MEKVSHILINRKDEKKIKKLKHTLSLLGIDVDLLMEQSSAKDKKIEDLEISVSELKEEVKNIKKEATNLIQSELNKIAVNVHNEAVKTAQNNKKTMETYIFKGNRINEKY